MKTPTRQPRTAQAFTLIEIIVVMALIAVLAGMVIGGMNYYSYKANEGRTKILINSIERALEEYKGDNGFYPQGNGAAGSTLQVYVALYGDGKLVRNADTGVVTINPVADGDNADATDGTSYLSILNPSLTGKQKNVEGSGANYAILDAWGNELRYTCPGANNPDFDLWSHGGDGNNNTSDDINNW